MTLIATYNANSINTRLDHIVPWLESFAPDILLIQEIKSLDENFPRAAFEAAGYQVATHGQKTYNGVAILSKHDMLDIEKGLPNFPEDEQARVIAATIKGVRYFSLYIPNGNPIYDENAEKSQKYLYKLKFLNCLYAHVRDQLIPSNMPFLLGGDYNICPDDIDCYDPAGFENDALCQPEIRDLHYSLLHLGLVDAWRYQHPKPDIGYSYWDYQGGSFHKDQGVRIDHLLLSPYLCDHLKATGIAIEPRQSARPSDHTPVWCKLSI